jgi:hypothetical protein
MMELLPFSLTSIATKKPKAEASISCKSCLLLQLCGLCLRSFVLIRFQMPVRRICRWKLMTKAGEARVDGDES